MNTHITGERNTHTWDGINFDKYFMYTLFHRMQHPLHMDKQIDNRRRRHRHCQHSSTFEPRTNDMPAMLRCSPVPMFRVAQSQQIAFVGVPWIYQTNRSQTVHISRENVHYRFSMHESSALLLHGK